MKYRADIDGLRAFAVLSVILFHAGFSGLSGGFVGVDIFFVISGYVIAQSILGDVKDGKFSILSFYAKRVRRIFPALVFTVLITFIGAIFILLPDYFVSFSKSISAVSIFISNLFFWKDSGYFSADALSKPLLHTWSLSVEEQYYILSPVYTYLVYRYFPKYVFWSFLIVLLSSLGLSVYATDKAPTANFFLPLTRALELLIGAMLAQTPPPSIKKKWVAETLGLLGLACLIYPVMAYTEATPFPGATAILPCIGVALLIYSGSDHSTLISKALAFRPVNLVGKMSYSLYLVHWPVIVAFYYLTLSRPDMNQFFYILILTFGLGFISWHFVEKPFRHISIETQRAKLLWAGFATIIALMVLGQLGVFYKGFPTRYADFTQIKISGNDQWNKESCFLDNSSDYKLWQQEKCNLTQHTEKRKVLLWGDSFAAQYVPGIIANKADIGYNVIQYTMAGCPPILSYYSYARPNCAPFNANAINIIRDQKFDAVILSAKWTDLRSRGYDELKSTIDELDKIGIPFLVIGQSPEFSIDVQIIKYHQKDKNSAHPNAWNVFFDMDINKELEEISGSSRFINPMTALCEGTLCPYYKDGFLFEDYGHFSVEGSSIATKAYFPKGFLDIMIAP